MSSGKEKSKKESELELVTKLWKSAEKTVKELGLRIKILEDENQRLAEMSKRLLVDQFEIKNLILNHLANVTCDCGGGQRAPLCFLHQALKLKNT